jgi:hypothetical protein
MSAFLNSRDIFKQEMGNRERETVHQIFLKMKAVPDRALSSMLIISQQHPYVSKFRQDE